MEVSISTKGGIMEMYLKSSVCEFTKLILEGKEIN